MRTKLSCVYLKAVKWAILEHFHSNAHTQRTEQLSKLTVSCFIDKIIRIICKLGVRKQLDLDNNFSYLEYKNPEKDRFLLEMFGSNV